MITSTQAKYAIELAEKNVNNACAMPSSARLCLSDAQLCALCGDYRAACQSSLRSLSYSCGVFSKEYQDVKTMVQG